MTAHLFAFDFDGVICDSAGETGATGWKAASLLEPDVYRGPAPAEILRDFCRVRPVLETGFESILLIQLLKQGVAVEDILADYSALRNQALEQCGRTQQELIHLFGTVRDEWITEDFPSWLGTHQFYPGIVDAINHCPHPAVIITTKETRFAVALAKHAGLRIQEGEIFGLESGKKAGVLAELAAQYPGATIHFIEDRLKTLQSIGELSASILRKYFATWGYNTLTEVAQARRDETIDVVGLPSLLCLLHAPDLP